MPSQDTHKPPPLWVKRLLPLALVAGAVAVWWTPSGAPPNVPTRSCPTLSAEAFAAARARGATRAELRVRADGSTDLQLGPGVRSCSGRGDRRVCRQASDLVVEVRADGAAPRYLLVPAGSEHRFVLPRSGRVCEMLSG